MGAVNASLLAARHPEDTGSVVHLAHIGFHRQPQVFACLRVFRQKPLNAIMTDRSIQQARQSRLRRQPERTDEIIQ